MLQRRAFAAAALGLAAGANGELRSAAAQQPAAPGAFPARPVTVLVPWGAGGSTDAFARVLSARLGADLGQPFVVDNRTGANGTIGMTAAARARPDGYTVVVAPNSTYAIAPMLYQVPYDAERGFAGVGLLASMPFFALVNKNSRARTLADYVAMAKRAGAREGYANPGIGSTSHLAAESFLQTADLQVNDVGYRSGGDAIRGLLQGEAGLLFMPSSAVISFMQSGEMRALAVTTKERSPLAPDVPTFAESGFPGYEVVEHVAMLAPAGTPAPLVARLNAACHAALHAPDMQERLTGLAITPTVRPVEEWPAYLAAESAKWREVIRARNIRVT
jgi:tripartite-type tricarboxylate transporter receptor subunit TctC